MVKVELRVISSYNEGLLIALSDVFNKNGFTVFRHRRSRTGSGVAMTLLAKGPQHKLLRLEEQIGTHYMVDSLEIAELEDENGSTTTASFAAPVPTATPAPIQVGAETTPFLVEADATPDINRIEQVLPQVARDYPRIFSSLTVFERNVDPAQRAATMHAAGNRIGAWVYKRDFALGARLPLQGSISRVALPALKQLVSAKEEDGALVMNNSPFVIPGQQPSQLPQCHFFRGFLEGLLNTSGHLGNVRVEETSCCARGDAVCRFEFRR